MLFLQLVRARVEWVITFVGGGGGGGGVRGGEMP